MNGGFMKARKNVVTLFEETLSLKVLNINVLYCERVIILQLENQHQLALKLFGKLSNVLHYYYGNVVDIFKHSLPEDFKFCLLPNCEFQNFEDYLNTVDLTFDELLALPYWDKSFKSYIHILQEKGLSAIEACNELYQIYLKPCYYVQKDSLNFSIIPYEDNHQEVQTYYSVNEALNTFVKLYYTHYLVQVQKTEIVKQIEKQIENFEYKVQSNKKSIEIIEKSRSYEELANILMANLPLKVQGLEKYVFDDFYNDNQPIEIILKPNFTILQNAEWYYQKHKKRKKELEKLEQMFFENENQLQRWRRIKTEVIEIQSLGELIKWLKNYPELLTVYYEKKQALQPYREFIIEGYKIWVGKDAKSNDQLTLHYSQKYDIWLHAKDVSGSHVVIKTLKGVSVPKTVLIRAAELAGFYSKNRNQTYIPVIYTEKKFVRKGKGLPPGKVIVERENIIFVTPKSYEQIMSEIKPKN